MNTPENIKLILGLGNPGPKYARTYHNAGLWAVEELAQEPFLSLSRKHFAYSKQEFFVLVKPLTFMNESGEAVAAALKYFKIKPEDILVIHDDSDLEIGKYKLTFGQGAAGHRGVSSVISALKTKNFWRLRLGIRGQEKNLKSGRIKAEEFVLRTAPKEDRERIYSVVGEWTKKFIENIRRP